VLLCATGLESVAGDLSIVIDSVALQEHNSTIGRDERVQVVEGTVVVDKGKLVKPGAIAETRGSHDYSVIVDRKTLVISSPGRIPK
jgi:hypothetical protein